MRRIMTKSTVKQQKRNEVLTTNFIFDLFYSNKIVSKVNEMLYT